jgi:hypothetical protein
VRRTLALFIIGSSLACARNSPEANAPEGAASSPVAPPEVGVDACVESQELKAFVSSLEARRGEARDAALAALGARREVRRGTFLEAPAARKLGEVFEQGGKRLVVIAEYPRESQPTVALAVHGHDVRRLEERPRAHAVPVQACGVTPCRQPQQSVPPRRVLPVAVELGAGETLGQVLVVTYDYWWAQVSQAQHAPCPSAS